jgi:uroporphyrinogen-III synthase
MTIKYLKKGKHEADRAVDDAKVSKIVEDTLQAIAEKGDEALREFSITERFISKPTTKALAFGLALNTVSKKATVLYPRPKQTSKRFTFPVFLAFCGMLQGMQNFSTDSLKAPAVTE